MLSSNPFYVLTFDLCMWNFPIFWILTKMKTSLLNQMSILSLSPNHLCYVKQSYFLIFIKFDNFIKLKVLSIMQDIKIMAIFILKLQYVLFLEQSQSVSNNSLHLLSSHTYWQDIPSIVLVKDIYHHVDSSISHNKYCIS